MQRHIPLRFELGKQIFRVGVFRGDFVLRGRRQVRQPRLNLAHAAHVRADVPRRFKDSPVLVQQHQIAVPPHDFQHQPAQDVVAQFIHRVNIDVNHAVAVHLLDAQNAPAEDLLAQEHTEHRRFKWILEIQIREVAARIVRRRAQQQPMIRRSRANQQHNRILLRLRNAVDSPARQNRVHLPRRKPQCQAIHRHKITPPTRGSASGLCQRVFDPLDSLSRD